MKGAASTIVLLLIAAVVIATVAYSYYKPTTPSLPTGRVVTEKVADTGSLGLQESCNPNKDQCVPGSICKLGRDNIYRCLR